MILITLMKDKPVHLWRKKKKYLRNFLRFLLKNGKMLFHETSKERIIKRNCFGKPAKALTCSPFTGVKTESMPTSRLYRVETSGKSVNEFMAIPLTMLTKQHKRPLKVEPMRCS